MPAHHTCKLAGIPDHQDQIASEFLGDGASGALEIVTITPEIDQAAWQIFERYDQVPDLSYTDCTTFAVMQQRGITLAFTGDKHFHILGFTTQP